jgi:hypothetical protein|tara:strand:- start:2463 stop:3164 length:702 start_codon:yes stop_codon:yes gene_type:complete
MGQLFDMLSLVFQFIGRILSFALRGSVRQTDSWQIIAGGTALPSIALGVIYGLVGWDTPTVEADQWATYFGYGLATWLAIRLVVAPFFIWKEQYEETAELRLELSKPERLVLEHLAKHRAKARAKLASLVEDLQTCAYAQQFEGFASSRSAELSAKIRGLEAESGVADAFCEGRKMLMAAISTEADIPNAELAKMTLASPKITKLLQRYLVADITAESLALQLPKSIEPKIRQ